MDYGWIEIDAALGAPLWSAYRQHMGTGTESIGVIACSSDPDGYHGQPSMMTVVGLSGGRGAPLLKLETSWDAGWNDEHKYVTRENQVTHYWLPIDPLCPYCEVDR